MKLVDKSTGNELQRGDPCQDFRGECYTLQSWREPHKPSSSGHVYVRPVDVDYECEFFPSVINAEFVED